MPHLLADENLNRTIVTGVLQELPAADFVRVQDLQLDGTSDPALLERAAQDNRVIVSHDVSTMTLHASDRLSEGRPFSGLLLIPSTTSVAIEELVLLCQCSEHDEWTNLIAFLPL